MDGEREVINLKKIKRRLVTSAIILALAILAAVAIGIYSEYIQILEIGEKYTKIFWINLNMKIFAWITSFVFIFAIFLINGASLRSNLNNLNVAHPFRKFWVTVGIFFALSFLFSGVFGAQFAEKILLFNNSQSFNLADPIFHKDIGYYVFQRPFLMAIANSATQIMGITILINLLVYFTCYIQKMGAKLQTLWNINTSRAIATHNIATVLLFFAIKALTFQFQAEDLLTNVNSNFTGAGFTDINIWLHYYRIVPYVLLGVVVLSIVFLVRNRAKLTLATILVYPGFYIAFALAAGIIQTTVVLPNEAVRESQYINDAIRFTKAAYNISDNLQKSQFDIDNKLTASDIVENRQIIDNIRITDYEQNIRTLNQIQNIRGYYTFMNSDITTYDINGAKTACYVSAREINTYNLPSSAKNYINLKMKYTHGMGVVMSAVSQITSEGQPATIIKDIPTRSIDGAPQIIEPRIYYGENTTDYAIVGTKSGEVDEVAGDGYKYQGYSGIKLDFWNRVLFALRNADFNMLISGQITSESRLLLNRQIVQRAQKAFPFLDISDDPGLVITDDGYLVWVLDGYTKTNAFPYSEKTADFNYIRNSVKILIGAYHGTVSAYIMDDKDPIINAYAKMYPGIFEDGPLPTNVSGHIRYPEYLFTIQAEKLAKYHVTDSLTFFQRDDLWTFANRKTNSEKSAPVGAYFCLIQLENEAELVGILPYTLVNKENLVGWLAVRCEYDNYGKMVLYNFPEGRNIYGTYQIENKIDTDPEISKNLTLWGQGGSQVIRGNIIVVPIANSLLYVEPVYLTAGKDGISEVKGVVVAFEDKVVMADTLDNALGQLFGIYRPDIDENIGTKNAISAVTDAWKKYQQAASSGDWEVAGRYLSELRQLMPQLEAYGLEL